MTRRRYKKVAELTPHQRAVRNVRSRRNQARRALRDGRTYKPRIFTPGLPTTIDQSHFEIERQKTVVETPIETRRRRARERYAKQTMKDYGRYTPRGPMHLQKGAKDRELMPAERQRLNARIVAHLATLGDQK